ncbi:chemotaxis protein CheB [Pedobacter lithocola]|uniref:protein-glutamate methylesterase n=1 Tax=Pedobacter lithocola TaxID=1908239 RepID=A0ABV8PC66_9SPHI
MEEALTPDKCSALVIGGSAGSLDVLLKIFPDLDKSINFPIIIVTHRKPGNDTLLADLLQNRTGLKIREVEEKEEIMDGCVYIAPADYHLLIEKNKTFSLDYSEKVNYSRPSIDVTFQSAAEIYKNELVCVLLSGSNADGVEGLKTVNNFGGSVVIQDPQTAIMPYMPQQAVLNVKKGTILDAENMANFINKLATK